jgi:hypothetical protein
VRTPRGVRPERSCKRSLRPTARCSLAQCLWSVVRWRSESPVKTVKVQELKGVVRCGISVALCPLGGHFRQICDLLRSAPGNPRMVPNGTNESHGSSWRISPHWRRPLKIQRKNSGSGNKCLRAIPSSRTHAPAWGPAPAWRTSRGKGHRSRIDLREPVTSGRAARGSAAGAPMR